MERRMVADCSGGQSSPRAVAPRGRKAGRKEGRKDGRKERRKEGTFRLYLIEVSASLNMESMQ
jgi:hypothetical protein